jgi:hypothetical protein
MIQFFNISLKNKFQLRIYIYIYIYIYKRPRGPNYDRPGQ